MLDIAKAPAKVHLISAHLTEIKSVEKTFRAPIIRINPSAKNALKKSKKPEICGQLWCVAGIFSKKCISLSSSQGYPLIHTGYPQTFPCKGIMNPLSCVLVVVKRYIWDL
ncbi:MAG: hypothetical protein ACI8RT_000765 [Candidatus Azotimanducaceae bacterium]|jgi:hypothetical protein|tara:strand:- start:1422 stop:1751 length:330 start_codon:yes stop_codon:yes gene_type:complete